MLLPDQTTVRQHSPIQLNDKERKVLDCLGKHHGFMTVLQINEQTRIARATVYQKLKALSSDRKGKWVEKGADGRYRILRMS
jgi:DNA-binding IclR family transcriptional regulator